MFQEVTLNKLVDHNQFSNKIEVKETKLVSSDLVFDFWSWVSQFTIVQNDATSLANNKNSAVYLMMVVKISEGEHRWNKKIQTQSALIR